MHVPALVLGLLLSFGQQVVLGNFQSVSFSSISQCGPFNITFSGGRAPSALPLTLTVVPFLSDNIQKIPLPNNSWDAKSSTGAAITFLPFAAGTSFVASLDDANGEATGATSDVVNIQPSDSTSCLPAGGSNSTPAMPYTLNGELSQCQPFNLTFDSTAVGSPKVRSFRPGGTSLFLNATSQTPGSTSFIEDNRMGHQIVMLFDDGNGNRQSTNLTTVGGNSSSSGECVKQKHKQQKDNANFHPQDREANGKGSLPSQTIIIIVASTLGAIGVISVLMGFYIYRQRRKRLGKVGKFTKLDSNGENGDTSDPEKNDLPPLLSNLPISPPPQARLRVATSAVPRPYPTSPQYVRGHTHFGSEGMIVPVVAIGTPVSPEFIDYRDRGAERSPWIMPDSRRSSYIIRPMESPDLMPVPGSASDRSLPRSPRIPSPEPDMDIDQILDMATMYSQPPTAPNTARTSPEHLSIPPPTRARVSHNHAPLDVPIAAERISVFTTATSGRRMSMESFMGGSPATPMPYAQIATAQRAGSAKATVTRTVSQQKQDANGGSHARKPSSEARI